MIAGSTLKSMICVGAILALFTLVVSEETLPVWMTPSICDIKLEVNEVNKLYSTKLFLSCQLISMNFTFQTVD